MKIRSAVPKNGCLIFLTDEKKTKKNICKTYTHSRHLAARMRKKRVVVVMVLVLVIVVVSGQGGAASMRIQSIH